VLCALIPLVISVLSLLVTGSCLNATVLPVPIVFFTDSDLMLFDVRGEAVCPTCGVRYRRTLNVIALAE
jgi:hypothetical protein